MSDKQKRHSLPILPRPENVTVSYASLENQIYSELNNGQIIMQKKSNFMGPAGVPEALLQIRRASVASTTRDSNQDKMKGGFDYKGSGSEFSDGRERKDSKEKEVSNKVEKLVEKKIEEEFARKDSVLRNANVNSDKIEREVSKSKDSLRILEARTISPPIDRSVRSSSSTPVISPIKANRDISNQSLESSEKSESNSIFNSVYSPPSSPLSSLKAPDASIPVAKILLLGDSGVGKSAIMGRFTDNRFDEGLLSTAGVDFKSKLHTIDNQQLRLTIWVLILQIYFINIRILQVKKDSRQLLKLIIAVQQQLYWFMMSLTLTVTKVFNFIYNN